MENGQLRGRRQARQEILLTTQIVPANLTSIMLRQTARNHNCEMTSPCRTNVRGHTPLTDGFVGRELRSRRPPPNNRPNRLGNQPEDSLK